MNSVLQALGHTKTISKLLDIIQKNKNVFYATMFEYFGNVMEYLRIENISLGGLATLKNYLSSLKESLSHINKIVSLIFSSLNTNST